MSVASAEPSSANSRRGDYRGLPLQADRPSYQADYREGPESLSDSRPRTYYPTARPYPEANDGARNRRHVPEPYYRTEAPEYPTHSDYSKDEARPGDNDGPEDRRNTPEPYYHTEAPKDPTHGDYSKDNAWPECWRRCFAGKCQLKLEPPHCCVLGGRGGYVDDHDTGYAEAASSWELPAVAAKGKGTVAATAAAGGGSDSAGLMYGGQGRDGLVCWNDEGLAP